MSTMSLTVIISLVVVLVFVLGWLASLGWAALDRYQDQLTEGHRRVDDE